VTTRRPFEVLVFVRRGDEVLVVRRSEARGGYWHSIAGGVDWDESADDAARRELLEETGLDAPVRPLGYRFVYSLADEPDEVRARFAPTVTQVEAESFVAEAPAGWEPTLDDEHVEYRWCSVDEAEQLLFWPEPREAVRRL
jgi:8-oxo-dGTP pyrophosphatase MutT (NUDIX family)